MWQYDPIAQQLFGERKLLVDRGVKPEDKPIWAEGPHIFKKDGYYYLTAAEGGTSDDHSQTIFRSESVTGPYAPAPINPILTQRDLDPARANPVYATGHADFVKLANGDWWAVFLGTRPYKRNLTNLGRETFLLPVRWQDGWPMILEKGQAVPLVLPRPALPVTKYARETSGWRDDFDRPLLSGSWLMRRLVSSSWLNLKRKQGWLALGRDGSAAFVGLRLQHHEANIETELRFESISIGDRAGLLAIADENHKLFFGAERFADGVKLIVTAQSRKSQPASGHILATSRTALDIARPIRLRMEFKSATADFTYLDERGRWKTLLTDADATILATEYDGLLFTGTLVGPYAGPALN
jgi:alpha-N-arabinofuranosidase